MEVNGVAVMKRRDDSWLNATQILKVAGVVKARRTKTLEKEIAAIRVEMIAECESKLTEGQRKSLADRRSAAEAKKAKASVPAKSADKGSE